MPASKTRSKSRSRSRSKTLSKSKSKSVSRRSKYILQKEQTKTYVFFNNALLKEDEFLESMKLVLEQPVDFTVLPKPDEDGNRDYRNICTFIDTKINHSQSLCKGINPEYIKDSMRGSHAIIVIGSNGMEILPNGNLFAFALIELNERKNLMYLDVICSNNGIQGAGQILMTEIERVAKTIFITKIVLKSVFGAIGFYEKYGFAKKGVCENNEELCEMTKRIR